MLTFAQFLLEAPYHSTVDTWPMYQRHYAVSKIPPLGTKEQHQREIFVNPTSKELASLKRSNQHGETKAIVHGTDVYVWDANAFVHHDDVMEHLGFTGTPITIAHHSKIIYSQSHGYDDPRKVPWFKERLPDYKFQDY